MKPFEKSAEIGPLHAESYMTKRKFKKELIKGLDIEGRGFVIRRDIALVYQRIKLQKSPAKRGRPPVSGKVRMLLVKSFERNKGNITRSCKEVGISRQTLYRWLHAAVPVEGEIKLQKLPKRGRPPIPGKVRMLFVKSFERHYGNITKASQELGISRQTVYRWLNTRGRVSQKFRNHLKNTRPLEAKKDFFEACLMDLAAGQSSGSARATISALKALAWGRDHYDWLETTTDETAGFPIELTKLRKR